MANENSNSSPFEWLAGGLFFGKKTALDSRSGGIEGIDACTDVTVLMHGLNEDFAMIQNHLESQQKHQHQQQSLEQQQKQPFQDQNTQQSQTQAQFQTNSETDPSTATQFLAARLSRLRFLLYEERRGPEQQRQQQQQQYSQHPKPVVVSGILSSLTKKYPKLLPMLLQHLHQLPFESRKHFTAILNYMLVCGLAGDDAQYYQVYMVRFVQYLEIQVDLILQTLVTGHDTSQHNCPDVCLHYGSMFRSCLRHASLFRHVVGSTANVERYVFPFLDYYAHDPNFDIASDAMESVRAIFTAGSEPQLAEYVAEMLTRDYEAIWDDRFHAKLLSADANYMTRRVALQVLSTVLLTRTNYSFMIRYVSSRTNLVLAMHLLRDTSPHITLDAFHVFKVFVANPNKPPEIIKILSDNKEKLCKYLKALHQDKEVNDSQFRDEKAFIIATIEGL